MRLKPTDRALNIRVPEGLYQAAQHFGLSRRLSLADVTRLALSEFVGWGPDPESARTSSRRATTARKR